MSIKKTLIAVENKYRSAMFQLFFHELAVDCYKGNYLVSDFVLNLMKERGISFEVLNYQEELNKD